MLTTGIEVEARPPGKKIKRLSLLSGGERSLTDVAFQMPNGNFMVLQDVYMYIHYANEDATQPRAVRVRVVGTGATWASKLAYTDGEATAKTNTWGTLTDGVDPGDFFSGAAVECVGFHYDESTLVTW
jgi:hypothetical protein